MKLKRNLLSFLWCPAGLSQQLVDSRLVRGEGRMQLPD